MRRVLFVDDEPRILEGLRARLRRQRSRWEMFFVESGEQALDLLRTQPVDVIVSDMRMPRMDGATLLRRVQDEYPQIVRIVLSGHAELETALRAVPVAHQFLTKPSEPGVIEEVIERACRLQTVINNEAVRTAVAGIKRLPSLPRTYSQLLQLLQSDRSSADEVARVLKQDMALCAKLLQLVNSAFFRLSRSITRIEAAVSYLGFDMVRRLALAAEVFEQWGKRPRIPGFSLEVLQTHALNVAGVAADLVYDKRQKEDAFVTGLLHDIGKLILAVGLPDQVKKVIYAATSDGRPMHLAESGLFGVTHAEVGAYLLSLWGLPYPIVEAVASHHAPERVESTEFGLVGAVHVADALVNEVGGAACGAASAGSAVLDNAYLERLNLAGRVEQWRELARLHLQAPVEDGPLTVRS
jgi:HD-like signal output (HDOD) protein